VLQKGLLLLCRDNQPFDSIFQQLHLLPGTGDIMLFICQLRIAPVKAAA
jgi:hypothetical protein